ncbi:MAG: translation initiation factor IF-2 [Chthonomonas sp.]|nr:translation initiation factor IF-2 [Chthonomonas sp.]
MQQQIESFAKTLGATPGQVERVLDELGVAISDGAFESDEETLELISEAVREAVSNKTINLTSGATLRDVAHALGVSQSEVQKKLVSDLKVMATLTTSLKDDVVEKLVKAFGFNVSWGGEVAKPEPKLNVPSVKKPAKPAGDQKRPPVVTILGHVDHGKTSLLDYIRKANVAAKEAGGITQHIGAYQVSLPEGKISFLDTPGHAAFTAMRARGAQVTDIAILVVAADDGIMPQTIEAISHVKNADVPMIVAVNKIDKPGANPDRVLQQLTEHQVIAEAYGGQTIVCPVSALTGEGVPQLLEMILLQADVMELKADPHADLEGVVIEAKVDRGRGPVATVLVKNGTLRIGDAVVVGQNYGKIKAMTDHRGERLKEAGPSMPAEILGLDDVPTAGDKVEPAEDERSARAIATERADEARRKSLSGQVKRRTFQDLKNQLVTGEIKDLNLVVKADVQGSVEAVRGMLEKIENDEVQVKVIHSAVGSITESDILLASAADAIVIGFNSKPEGNAKNEAERKGVEIRQYRIIYELIEDIERAVKGMLEPKYEENYLGTVEIRVRFQFGRKGIIAGCYVTDGKVVRNAKCRVTRGKELVHEGTIGSLKHLKDDVKEVTMGMECGITFETWAAFAEGDMIEAYEMVRIND